MPAVKLATSSAEIRGCFPVLSQLRPHLSRDGFVETIHRMQKNNRFNLAYLDDDGVKAVAGFRISEWLFTGAYLEIEDLVTKEGHRSKGYGGLLFDWLRRHATESGCRQLRLVSGVSRADAHRFYLAKGMSFEAKYFSCTLA